MMDGQVETHNSEVLPPPQREVGIAVQQDPPMNKSKPKFAFKMNMKRGNATAINLQRLEENRHIIDLSIRVSHLVLGVVILICISSNSGVARLAAGNIVYFNVVCAIITELILQVLESLNVPERNSTPIQWTYSLLFLNVFWCVLFLISAAVSTAFAVEKYYNTDLTFSTPKGLAAAGFFLWITFLVYAVTSLYYVYRYFQLKKLTQEPRNGSPEDLPPPRYD